MYGDVLKSRIQKTNLSCLTFSELLGIFTDVLEECSRGFPEVQKRGGRHAASITRSTYEMINNLNGMP